MVQDDFKDHDAAQVVDPAGAQAVGGPVGVVGARDRVNAAAKVLEILLATMGDRKAREGRKAHLTGRIMVEAEVKSPVRYC